VDLNTYKKNDVIETMMQRTVATLTIIDAVTTVIFVFAKPWVLLSVNINPNNVKRKKMLAIKIKNIVLFRVNGLKAVSIALQKSSMSI
jgi:hypothetical protein